MQKRQCDFCGPVLICFVSQDDLLLLKKGGRTTFFGELGQESCNLVNYFESRGAKNIEIGENPVRFAYVCGA